MNPNSKKIRLYILIMVLLASAATALRAIACITELSYSYGYFNDKLLVSTSGYIALAGVLIMLTYPIFSDKMNADPSFSTPSTYVPTGIVSVGIPYLAITIKRSLDPNAASLTRNLVTVLVVLSIFSVIHFFLTAFDADADAETRGYFSLATVLFMALYAAYLYFDTTLPINSPNKVVDQMAFLSSSLFFLYESRLSLSREKWGGYVTFGLISSILTAYSSIPAIIVYAMKGKVISNSIEESVFILTIFLFTVSRLMLTSFIKERKESDIIAAMGDFAESRSAIILESMKVHKEAFAVQMTIDDLIEGQTAELVFDENEEKESKEAKDQDDEPTPEQIDFFCEGGLEISENDTDSLKNETEVKENEEDKKEEEDEENSGN